MSEKSTPLVEELLTTLERKYPEGNRIGVTYFQDQAEALASELRELLANQRRVAAPLTRHNVEPDPAFVAFQEAARLWGDPTVEERLTALEHAVALLKESIPQPSVTETTKTLTAGGRGNLTEDDGEG